jgi:hypothetical protein
MSIVEYIPDLRHRLARRFAGCVAVHTEGLIGDHILISTTFDRAIRDDKPFLIYSTYYSNPYPHRRSIIAQQWRQMLQGDIPRNVKRLALIEDLLREFIEAGQLKAILYHPRKFGPFDESEIGYLKSVGCEMMLDCSLYNPQYSQYPKGDPYIGPVMRAAWEAPREREFKLALFRWSGIHNHYPDRLRPYPEWKKFEVWLLEQGVVPILFGYDDPLPNDHGLLDYRKKLSVYETLLEIAKCHLIVSVTSFPPVYGQYYVPCIVLADKRDIPNQRNFWRRTGRYHVVPISTGHWQHVRELVRDLIGPASTRFGIREMQQRAK